MAFVSPGRSRRSQVKLDRMSGRGQRAGRKVDEKRPSFLERLFETPFEKARKATAKSAGLGRKARSKVPF